MSYKIFLCPEARFSKAPETFQARKAIAKSRTLRLQSGFIHTFLIWIEFLVIQEVSGVYTSPFLDTDQPKMASRARQKFPGFSRKGPLFGVFALRAQNRDTWLRCASIFKSNRFLQLKCRGTGHGKSCSVQLRIFVFSWKKDGFQLAVKGLSFLSLIGQSDYGSRSLP